MAPSVNKNATPKKASTSGVKKQSRSAVKAKRGSAMAKMQAFFKKHRADYKSLDFKEQQKKLGEDWKKSSENPKNSA